MFPLDILAKAITSHFLLWGVVAASLPSYVGYEDSEKKETNRNQKRISTPPLEYSAHFHAAYAAFYTPQLFLWGVNLSCGS